MLSVSIARYVIYVKKMCCQKSHQFIYIDDVTPIQVGLEQDSYSVGEEISDSDLALLVCANVSTDVESRFTVTIALQSGTAQGKSIIIQIQSCY